MDSPADQPQPTASVDDLRLAAGVERCATAALLLIGCVVGRRLLGDAPPIVSAIAAVTALTGMRLTARFWLPLLIRGKDNAPIVSQCTLDGRATAVAAGCGLILSASWPAGLVASILAAGWLALAGRHRQRIAPPFADTGQAVPEAIRQQVASAGFPPDNILIDGNAHVTARLLTWHGRPYILLAPDALETFTAEEVAVIVAHELGHFARRDVLRTDLQRAGLYVLAGLVAAGVMKLAAPGYLASAVFAAMLAVAAFETLSLPLMLWLSRSAERGANAWALEATGDSKAFASMMTKLHQRQGSPPEPTWIGKLTACEHPSLADVLCQAEQFADATDKMD